MRCEEAENNIAEYLNGRLSPESEFPEHLAQCPRCRNEVQELRTIWAELGHFTVPAASPVMNPKLAAAMAEAKLEPPTRRTPMPYIIKPILVILLSAGSALFLGHRLVQPSLEHTVASEQPAANDGDRPYRGGANAKITLVEYGDYECPPCATFNPIVNAVIARYGNNLRFEFRHFPMTNIHPNALKASMAAEAAGHQNHYWEMHDLLLSEQKKWAKIDNAEQEFGKLATSIGLEAGRFLEEMNSPEMRQRVMSDIADANRAKIQAVPTFFLNGQRIQNTPTAAEGFFALIDAQLAAGH